MAANIRPKSTLIAYCVLAEKLKTPGQGIMQALTPFLAEACRQFSGQLFDAAKFSDAVSAMYGIHIPRLAALGLTDQLAVNGLLTQVTNNSHSPVYKYTDQISPIANDDYPLTEAEIESVLQSFVKHCRSDEKLDSLTDFMLEDGFLKRLLNLDSMRLLGRREASISYKNTTDTLVVNRPAKSTDQSDKVELHLDYLVSEFLLDLQVNNGAAFEQVSNRGGSVQLDSIPHFLSGSLAVNDYAAFGSAGRLSK